MVHFTRREDATVFQVEVAAILDCVTNCLKPGIYLSIRWAEASYSVSNLPLCPILCLFLPKTASHIQLVWPCCSTVLFFHRHRNLLTLKQNYNCVFTLRVQRACFSVPHFNRPAAGGLSHIAHEASEAWLLWRGVP